MKAPVRLDGARYLCTLPSALLFKAYNVLYRICSVLFLNSDRTRHPPTPLFQGAPVRIRIVSSCSLYYYLFFPMCDTIVFI